MALSYHHACDGGARVGVNVLNDGQRVMGQRTRGGERTLVLRLGKANIYGQECGDRGGSATLVPDRLLNAETASHLVTCWRGGKRKIFRLDCERCFLSSSKFSDKFLSLISKVRELCERGR